MAIVTARSVVIQAMKDSRVLGVGSDIQANELVDGIQLLNNILDGLTAYLPSTPEIKVASVTLPGTQEVTVGPTGLTPAATVELACLPTTIKAIAVVAAGQRHLVYPVDPVTYFDRADVSNTAQYPSYFFYEWSSPKGKIRFLDGTPTGPAEIQYAMMLGNVNPNSDMADYPRALMPYIRHRLAADVASMNLLDSTRWDALAQRELEVYLRSTQKTNARVSDWAAGSNGKFNIQQG